MMVVMAGYDQGWTEGYDYDTNRWVQIGDITNPDPASRGYQEPMQDTPGYQNWTWVSACPRQRLRHGVL